jgi:peptide/nickel transport system substrate-binding protein
MEPLLATSWTNDSPTKWTFKLRPGVVYHDGSAFNADDVVFSFERANTATSDVKPRLRTIKTMRKIDDLTVEVETTGPSPSLLNDLTFLPIFDQDWATKNNALQPFRSSDKQENYATRNANGTGPFKVVKFDPSGAELEPHAKWWGPKKHNITKAIFSGISADATRVAALLSGQVDMVFPVPQQDVDRVAASPNHKMMTGPEDRVVYLGMDQGRDELLYSNVKGKNPLKDIRVRQAFYQAIDTETIRKKVMRDAAFEVGSLITSSAFGFDPSIGKRSNPYNLDAAKALMKEAGYGNGFSITLDCPNNRYVNDEQICTAVVGMLARINVKVDLLAQASTIYFAKIGARDTSFYLHGWGSGTDAQSIMQILMHTKTEQQGSWNVGGYTNARIDELIKLIGVEMDTEKRLAYFKEAFDLHRKDIAVIPLHGQTLAWGLSKKVTALQRADDYLDLRFVQIAK